MTRKIITKNVSRENYRSYRGKALQFYGVMNICLQDREWDAVLLNGVHASISMCDALTVFHAGKHSKSAHHRDAALLLAESIPSDKNINKNVQRLCEIIDEKNLIEYQPKRFQEQEAFSFALKVERFFEWAKALLP